MQSNKKISVCIPVYGVEKYIERCARSLFEQTMIDGIEFIFVNDCTKDKSIEILEAVLAEYPQRKDQVKIIHHEKNGGLVAARNTGLKHAAGDYIIHCDSDDWVDVNMYEEMYKKAVETDADMVCCSFIQERVELGKQKTIYPKEFSDVDSYITKNFAGHMNSLCSKMYKKKLALDKSLYVPDHICMAEDLLRNSQMLLKCKKIAYVKNVCYHYYQNNSSIIHQWKREHYKNLLDTYLFLKQIFPEKYKKCLRTLFDKLFINAIMHYGKFADDDIFYKKIISEPKKIADVFRLIFDVNFSVKAKVAYCLSCINFKMSNRLIRLFFK